MKTKLFALLFLINIMTGTSGQDHMENIIHVWGGIYLQESTPFFVDHNGNIYLSGIFQDTVFFGSKDNFLVPLDSSDSFIAKVHPGGTVDWIQALTGFGHEYINDFEVDQDGYVYLIGEFGYTLTLDTANIVEETGNKNFICKLDPDGRLVELKLGSQVSEELNFYKMELDGNGQICLIGRAKGNQLFGLPFDPSGRNSLGYSGFLVKLNSSLDAEWLVSLCDSANLPCPDGSFYWAVEPDQSNNIYISGNVNSSPDNTTFLCKVDQDGDLLWMDTYTATASPIFLNLFTDNTEAVYAVGKGGIYISHDTISGQAIVVKFESEGEYLWGVGLISRLWTYVVDQNGYTYGIYYTKQFTLDGFIIIDPDGKIVYDLPFDKIEFQQLATDVAGNVFYNGMFSEQITIEDQLIIPKKGDNYLIGQLKAEEMISSLENETLKQKNSYQLYPNPFSKYTTIKSPDGDLIQRIDLIDIHGRIVRSIENINDNSINIHRENLPAGIYIIRIHSDETSIKKLIIR